MFKVYEELSWSLLGLTTYLNFEIFEIDNFELSNFGSGQLALYSMEIVLKKFSESKTNKAMKILTFGT